VIVNFKLHIICEQNILHELRKNKGQLIVQNNKKMKQLKKIELSSNQNLKTINMYSKLSDNFRHK